MYTRLGEFRQAGTHNKLRLNFFCRTHVRTCLSLTAPNCPSPARPPPRRLSAARVAYYPDTTVIN